ncbi:aminotransferase class III-fold pyridoxal phosphate-dependent enzyme [Parvibaculum sp.]|uniref:aminotransferase family protein n=1 Tax=Parvibaculum sp. TaxID=2024848 RepID=UPI001D5D560A|nr:aminotransferase class III-fold pyridoxal phosphate-dependent enzyme [Parvibaculum sp.]MBX3490699.1 aspartate aminotransferase family protein [Parvibaculum sp.]MCW5728603.1 aspartate aminotransferase family protein [Parvibaculum sp.]
MTDQTPLWPFVPSPRAVDITHAKGCVLHTRGGGEILDASGGAIVSNIGHGRAEVGAATAEAMTSMSYAVPPFLTPERTRLMERLRRAWLPAHLTRTWLASGGSEAVDAACRLAVQHFRAKGDNTRWKIIGRDISYHGTTLFTLGIAGHEARKRGFERLIPDMPLAPTPYALRSPLGRHHPDFDIAAADAFEALVLREGPETIAAFIAEPINGSSGGALMPGPRYWPRIQEICKRHGILLIIDEVMTGFGRTGKPFACAHFDIAPDILVSGKGLAGGYAPIVGVFASEEIVAPLAEGGQSLMFYTYGGHPGACAAADKVLQIMEDEDLVARAAARGRALAARLEGLLGQHPNVAEIRGEGLLRGIEIVRDRETLERFPESAAVTQRVIGAGLKRGVFFYGGGTGAIRDIVCLGPAFVVSDAELDRMAETLKAAIDEAVAAV